jgi:hypothetical protein
MKPTSDSRFDSRFDTSFDPNYAVQMLLDAAHELSLDNLLKKLTAQAVARPDIAFVQIWLLDKATGCLHLAIADGGVPPGPRTKPQLPFLSGQAVSASRRDRAAGSHPAQRRR